MAHEDLPVLMNCSERTVSSRTQHQIACTGPGTVGFLNMAADGTLRMREVGGRMSQGRTVRQSRGNFAGHARHSSVLLVVVPAKSLTESTHTW